MITKKGRSLADIVGSFEDEEPVATSQERTEEPKPTPAAAPKVVPISVFVTPEDRKRLKQLSLDTGLSVQRLGHEALNQMLEARGLAPLEPVSANIPSGRSKR